MFSVDAFGKIDAWYQGHLSISNFLDPSLAHNQQSRDVTSLSRAGKDTSMRYVRFRIQNFKGIRDTTVSLKGTAGASVFCFVGLNESGKTTILEAIHSFSPDASTGDLSEDNGGIGASVQDRVPRHQLSSFNGNISVTATLLLTSEDKSKIVDELEKDHNLKLCETDIPDEIDLERSQRFLNGDYAESYWKLSKCIRVKKGSQRKWREPDAAETYRIAERFWHKTPDIAYFPTFVFDFPDRVYLTDRGDKIDAFYRTVFQDILDLDGRGFNIQRDIVRRVRSEKLKLSWLDFWKAWQNDDSAAKIQQVIDRASATVTRIVLGRWDRIFGETTAGKEIFITYEIDEGEKRDARGAVTKTNDHDIYVRFQIKDGSRRFDINDRSLGFRWFFAFMLFTQFRVARSSSSRPILFLFDEPASNLHAAAQQKLIDCFPEIAKYPNALAYTTHSHYMVEPKWLEQTFIVTNRSDDPPSSILDAVSLDDESLDIKAETYRKFVNNHPSQTSYFQPILDRLEVKPSMFDIKQAGFVVEGKSDYYLLRYIGKMLDVADLPMMPALGAGTFNALVSIYVGWNLKFLFLLDADKQGQKERERYMKDYGIPASRLATLKELVSDVEEIEDLLDEDALIKIKVELNISTRPSKSEIRRFFQERLASDNVSSLSPAFLTRAKIIMSELSAAIERNSFLG